MTRGLPGWVLEDIAEDLAIESLIVEEMENWGSEREERN
jgi:hypothetical protein